MNSGRIDPREEALIFGDAAPETWYDRHTRSWVVQVKDKSGNQIGEADYVGHKSQAAALVKAYKKLMPTVKGTLEAIRLLPGMTASYKDGEYRIAVKGKPETAYFTDNAGDAGQTAMEMAQLNVYGKTMEKRNPRERFAAHDPDHKALLKKLDKHFAMDEKALKKLKRNPSWHQRKRGAVKFDPNKWTVVVTEIVGGHTGHMIFDSEAEAKQFTDNLASGVNHRRFGTYIVPPESERKINPMPRKGESEQEFVSRYMGSTKAERDFPNAKQRAAVAYAEYRRNPVVNKSHGYKTILTKYLPASNVKGARVKAWAEGGNSVTLSYDHGLDSYGNAIAAAEALQKKMEWGGDLIGGATPDGYAFNFIPETFHVPKRNPEKRHPRTFGIFLHTANKTRLHYNGDRFTNNGKPKRFRSMDDAIAKGRELIAKYPKLLRYMIEVAPIPTKAGERGAQIDTRRATRALGKI